MKFLVYLILTILSINTVNAQSLRDSIKQRILENRQNKNVIDESQVESETILGRDVLTHIPKELNSKRQLIIALHGGGGSAKHMARNDIYNLISLSEKYGFVLAIPNGTGAVGSQLGTWNAGACCGKARDEKVDDVSFLNHVALSLVDKYQLNRGQVYAIGMSNGGMMAHQLACQSKLFKAIVSVAGTDNTLDCKQNHASILHIHAIDDTHVLYNGGAGVDAFRDKSKVTEFTSARATFDQAGKRNNCSAASKIVYQQENLVCESKDHCSADKQVWLCTLEKAGHSWPGSKNQKVEQPVDINSIIMLFINKV